MKFELLKRIRNNRIGANASWIIFGSIGQTVLGFIVGVVTARYLGPSNYGVVTYAASIVNFLMPLVQLGLNSILVHEIVSNPKEENAIVGSAILLSFISAIVCIPGIFLFVSFANRGDNVTITVCLLYSFVLIFRSCELIKYWFQSRLLSKYPAIISLIAYGVMSLYKVFLLVTQKSIYWFAISNSVDYLVISISLVLVYRFRYHGTFAISIKKAKCMIMKGKYYIVSNMMISMYTQIDKIMLSNMINTKVTGLYSAAITCGGLVSFVYLAIIDSFRPIILSEKEKNNDDMYKMRISQLYSIIFYLSLVTTIVITLSSKVLIMIVYGKQYYDAIPVLRIIAWYTSFSVIAMVRDIWILAEHKEYELIRIHVFGALTNIILNYFLIRSIGLIGAAVASVITQLCVGIIFGFIMPQIRANNTLLLKAINPKAIIISIRNTEK